MGVTKFYIDNEGKFLGGWDGGQDRDGTPRRHPDVPRDAIEVLVPPPSADHTYVNGQWVAPPAAPEPSGPTRDEKRTMLRARVRSVAADRTVPQALRDALMLIDELL